MSDTGRPERLGDHSPSAKLVYKILEHDAPLTQSELADEAFLSPRTVRRVARELKQDGLLESHHSQTDGREVVYTLTDNDS